MTAPRDLSADIYAAGCRYYDTFFDNSSESDYIAAELTRLGWVHRDSVAAPACEVCWHNAWVPTEDGLRCDYCWMNERYMSLAANHVADLPVKP